MEMTYIYLGIFFILLGVVIKYFKLYFLIAGYNTMSKKEKEKVNVEKLATLLRNVLVFMGSTIILLGFATLYLENPETVDYIYFPIILGSVIYLIIKSNTSAYKK